MVSQIDDAASDIDDRTRGFPGAKTRESARVKHPEPRPDVVANGLRDASLLNLAPAGEHWACNWRRRLPTAPRGVRSAIEHMEAHLAEPMSAVQIARAAGIGARTLFKQFRDFCDATPMGHLRALRFERVRSALMHAEPKSNVTAIAMASGFTHLGRFSVDYR